MSWRKKKVWKMIVIKGDMTYKKRLEYVYANKTRTSEHRKRKGAGKLLRLREIQYSSEPPSSGGLVHFISVSGERYRNKSLANKSSSRSNSRRSRTRNISRHSFGEKEKLNTIYCISVMEKRFRSLPVISCQRRAYLRT